MHGNFYSGFCKIFFSKNLVRIDIKNSLHGGTFLYPGGSNLTPVAIDCTTLRRWTRPGTSSKKLNIFYYGICSELTQKTVIFGQYGSLLFVLSKTPVLEFVAGISLRRTRRMWPLVAQPPLVTSTSLVDFRENLCAH